MSDWNEIPPLEVKYEAPEYRGYRREEIDALVEEDIRAINRATGQSLEKYLEEAGI